MVATQIIHSFRDEFWNAKTKSNRWQISYESFSIIFARFFDVRILPRGKIFRVSGNTINNAVVICDSDVLVFSCLGRNGYHFVGYAECL